MKSVSARSESDHRIPIESYFRKMEHVIFATYLAAMLFGTFAFDEIENLVGADQLDPILTYLKTSWPKFAAESAFLESTNSKFLGSYHFAQMVFPVLAVLLILLCYIRVQSRAVATGSEKFVWKVRGIPYVAAVAALLTYFVFFRVMNLEHGAIASALFQTDLFYAWLPLIYTAITSVALRILLLIRILVFGLGR